MAYSTTNDYYRIRWIGGNDLSEKRNLAVYTVIHTEPPADEIHEIYTKDLSTGEERFLTYGCDPLFSPDGSRILFTHSNQLFLYELSSGQTVRLTTMRYGATGAVWSPAGDRVAFLSKVRLDCPSALWDQEMSTEDLAEEKRRQIEHPYVSFSDYGYKSDADSGFSVGTCTTLWSVKVDDPHPVLLSDGEREHVMPVFTADGTRILFASNRCKPKEASIAMDLFCVPAEGGEITKLTKDCWLAYYPASFQPLVTPDGQSVVFGALSPSLAGGMPLTRLFSAKLAGGLEGGTSEASTLEDPAKLAGSLEGRASEASTLEVNSLWPEDAPCHEATCFLYNSENMGGRRDTAAVSSDGNYLYFISGWQGAANLYRAGLRTPSITAVTQDRASWRSIRRSGSSYLLTKGTFTSTPQLYLATEAMMNGETDFAPVPLTDTNPWMDGMLTGPQELWIDTLDGESRVHGFVFPPQNARPGRKYPAVVYIHGGPTPFVGCALTYEHQCILGAEMGLIVMNFRGSSGYGEAHQNMARAYDGGAMQDILQFTAEAARQFDWIDPARLGVTGGSFGGYMTNWLCGHSKVFKAAVTQRSIANELIQYASSDMAGSSKEYADFSDFMMEKLKASPVSYAENIDIPFLILHGMQDMRCPVEHAHQLFTAVKETHPDNPVRMILFPGMNHSFPMSGPMDLRIAHYDAMIEWFRKYL